MLHIDLNSDIAHAYGENQDGILPHVVFLTEWVFAFMAKSIVAAKSLPEIEQEPCFRRTAPWEPVPYAFPYQTMGAVKTHKIIDVPYVA